MSFEPEQLLYSGESAQSGLAFKRYLEDAERGKTAFQLSAVSQQISPEIRRSWSGRTFTSVQTPSGLFDAVVCNISYHFHHHGQKYGTILIFTREAKRYFEENRTDAIPGQGNLLKLPRGLYEADGRIITYFG